MSNLPEHFLEDDFVVVDDDLLVLELIKRKLRDVDVKLTCFSNAQSALTYLQNHQPRVLIVDQRMPRLDGLAMLERLSNRNATGATAVFLCSASALPDRIHDRATSLGARPLSKDVYRSKTKLLGLLRHSESDTERLAGELR